MKLKYETEGNGCVLNGVPMLEIIDGKTVDVTDPDHVGTRNERDAGHHGKIKVRLFDKELKIDFSEGSQAFRLVSPNQILNGRMRLIVRVINSFCDPVIPRVNFSERKGATVSIASTSFSRSMHDSIPIRSSI